MRKINAKEFSTPHKKTITATTNIKKKRDLRQVKMNASFFVYSFGVCIYVQHTFDVVRNRNSDKKYLLELTKKRSKVYEKNIQQKDKGLDDKTLSFLQVPFPY